MKTPIKLSEWARREGVSKITAWRLATAGRVPGARLTATNQWVVDLPDVVERKVVAYARVSSHDQKNDLDRQVARIAEWAAAKGMPVAAFHREIGSGLNDKRKVLVSLLADQTVSTIIVEHRDRLARFGVAQLATALKAAGREIIVIDSGEIQDDLVQDMIDLMTCFSARLYGRRSARNRAKRALEELAT